MLERTGLLHFLLVNEIQLITMLFKLDFSENHREKNDVIRFPFYLGIISMSIVAYLIQHWRTLSQVTSGIGVLLLPIMLFVPESPRWLVAKQKFEEADHVIHKIVIGT